MTHTVTAKLNKAAHRHDNNDHSIFFVSLGEKNYDFKEKANKWTNYEAALFAKGNQVDFYEGVLTEGAIVTVSGSGIIVDDSNKDYAPKLILQDAKLTFVSGGQQQESAPRQQQAVQQAPQQQESTFDEIPF